MSLVEVISRERAGMLVGRILLLPENSRRLELRLKIIRVEAGRDDPGRIVIHGIVVDRAGREREGRSIIVSPFGISCYLQ